MVLNHLNHYIRILIRHPFHRFLIITVTKRFLPIWNWWEILMILPSKSILLLDLVFNFQYFTLIGLINIFNQNFFELFHYQSLFSFLFLLFVLILFRKTLNFWVENMLTIWIPFSLMKLWLIILGLRNLRTLLISFILN